MTVVLRRVREALGGAVEEVERLTVTGPEEALRSSFAVTAAGIATVGASLLAATDRPVTLDTRALAITLRSERYLLRDGRPVGSVFDPLSAFHRTADGWLRLHANYAWHRDAALRVLGCTAEQVPEAIAERAGVELGTWGARRGFDSIVQAACGIALEEGSPGVLPAQVLDHATGYLGTTAVLRELAGQRREGGTCGSRWPERRRGCRACRDPSTVR